MFVNIVILKTAQILHWYILSYKNKHYIIMWNREFATAVNYKKDKFPQRESAFWERVISSFLLTL